MALQIVLNQKLRNKYNNLNSVSEFCSNTGMPINDSKPEITEFSNGGLLRTERMNVGLVCKLQI